MASSSVPASLEEVLTLLEAEQRIQAKGDWSSIAPGQWMLAFDAILSVPCTEFIAQRTGWCLIASLLPGEDPVQVFPSALTGITATFPHQLHNGEPRDGEPWRTGKLCLDRPEAAFNRVSWSGVPTDARDRVIWHLGRLLLWIDAAATGELRRVGDSLEVPPTPQNLGYPIVGFDEAPSDFGSWSDVDHRWGRASLLDLPGAQGNRVLVSFSDTDGNVLRRVEWGAWAGSVTASETGIWVLLDRIPVVAPWGLPTTWRQLDLILEDQGIDLGEVLQHAGSALRTRTKKNQSITLLLGFPAEEKVGDRPSRVHWLAVGAVPLAHRQSKINGFRSTEASRQKLDAAVAKSPTKLNWIKTMNWSADQLRRRAPTTAKLSSAKIVLLGAGALGGVVADNLLRMGNRELTILDGERLEVGNLTRHVLSLESVGRNKALALAGALNSSMIDGRVVGYATPFPPADPSVIDVLRAADVVVDCTGADEVLRHMADFVWGNEKIFVSLSITWRAEGLLAYAASETTFPYHDAIDRFSNAGAPAPEPDESTMEGIGCWHPIFPATAEDMRLWGSIASRVIRDALQTPRRRFAYFRQIQDGQIQLVSSDV